MSVGYGHVEADFPYIRYVTCVVHTWGSPYEFISQLHNKRRQTAAGGSGWGVGGGRGQSGQQHKKKTVLVIKIILKKILFPVFLLRVWGVGGREERERERERQ